jgi:hypothetical protein
MTSLNTRWGSVRLPNRVTPSTMRAIVQAYHWLDEILEDSNWIEQPSPQGVCLVQNIRGYKVSVHPLESLQQDLEQFKEFTPGQLAIRINGFAICVELLDLDFDCLHLDITASFLQLLAKCVPVEMLPETVLMTTHPEVYHSRSTPETGEERRLQQVEQNTCIEFMGHCTTAESALEFMRDKWDTGTWDTLRIFFHWEVHPTVAVGLSRYIFEHRCVHEGDVWFALRSLREYDTVHYNEHVLPSALQHESEVAREYAAALWTEDASIDRWALLSPLLEEGWPVGASAHITLGKEPACHELLLERTWELLDGDLQPRMHTYLLQWLSKHNDIDHLLKPFFITIELKHLPSALHGMNIRGGWLRDCVKVWAKGPLGQVTKGLIKEIARNDSLDPMRMYSALMNTNLPQVQIEVLACLGDLEVGNAHRLLDLAWRSDDLTVFEVCHRLVAQEFRSYPQRASMYKHWQKNTTNDDIRLTCERALNPFRN